MPDLRQRLGALLFPDPPREFRARRGVKIVVRAIHAACAGVYAGAFVFDVAPEVRTAWGIAAIATGVVLLAVDLHESCASLLQVRGLVVLGKLVVLAILPWLGRAQVVAVLAIMVVASISSHAPGRWRYRLWAGQGRIRPSNSKG